MELKELREIWYTKKELKDKELDSPKNCNSIREKQWKWQNEKMRKQLRKRMNKYL